MQKEQNNTIKFILFILICITIYPLFKIGFISGDDLEYFLTADPSRWMADAKIYAEGTGRFYFYLVKWIYSVPYLIDSKVYFYFWFITPILSTLFLFVWLIKRVSKNVVITYLATLLCCSFLIYFAKHSAITAYPLYFTLSLTLILISFHLFVSYRDTKKYKHLLLSAFTFGIATLFYECYLVYYVLYFALIILRYSLKTLFKEGNWRMALKEMIPYFGMALLYITVYLSYYLSHQSGYSGNQVATDLTFSRMLKTLFTMSVNGLPFVTFFDYKRFFIDYALSLSSIQSYFILTITNISAIAYLKGGLVGLLIYLLRDRKLPRFSNKVLIWGVTLSVLFIILPHLPLAFSEKYTSYIQKTYITTSFAFFSVIGVLLCIYLFTIQSISKQWIKRLIQVVLGTILVIATVVTQYTNERVTDDMRISQYRFDLMDAVFQKQIIPEWTPVYIEPLHHTSSYFCKGVTRQSSPFDTYVDHQNGVKIVQHLDYNVFYDTYKNSDQTVSMVYFTQEPKRGDAYLIVAFVKGKMLQANKNENRVDSMVVGYISPSKTFTYAIEADSLFNGAERGLVSNIRDVGEQGILIQNLQKSKKITMLTFKGINIAPQSLIISNSLYPGTSRDTLQHKGR
jgi:hypothetical protein